jgi:predicted secreted protein
MPGTPGKKARVKWCATSGGSYVVIQGLRSFNHSIDGANIDDSEFGVDWVQRIQGLKDGKLTLTGMRRLGDTNGQNALLTAYLNDTSIYIQVLPDNGTTSGVGFQQEMKVSKFAGDSAVDGGIGLSIELEGTGAITLV